MARETVVHDMVQCKQIFQAKIYTNDGLVWIALATPWEEYIAIFFILKNEFILYKNTSNGKELREHAFQQMRNDWLLYRKLWFCRDSQEYYEHEPERLMYWSKEIE